MTNCFEVTRRPEGYIQHYDVDFSVATIEKRLYVKWLLREKQVLGPAGMHGVYDGMTQVQAENVTLSDIFSTRHSLLSRRKESVRRFHCNGHDTYRQTLTCYFDTATSQATRKI